MQKDPIPPFAPLPKMQTLRCLFHHKNLLGFAKSKFLFPPLFLSPNPSQRYSFRSLDSGNGGWEEESRVSSDPGENPRVWTTYDPFTDRLETLEEDPRSFRIENNLDGDSSEGDEKPQVSTLYDPLEGKLITKVEGEERKQKKPEKVRCSSGSNLRAWSAAIGKRRTGKVKVSWVCDNCGAATGQWWGTCPSCHRMGSVKRFSESEFSMARGAEVSEAAVRSWLRQPAMELVPQSLKEVNKGRNQSEWRIPLSGHFGMEVARVLGGGLVPGSLVLVGGDPGVGKSTLLLQLAAIIAQGHNYNGPAPVIYVSGEESIEQIGNRADRMRITTADLFLYSSTDIEDILDKVQALSPQALIVDSIQTVYLKGVTGSAGNVMQVKECTSALLRFAKQTNIPVLLFFGMNVHWCWVVVDGVIITLAIHLRFNAELF